jgi:hypothetical protein
MSVVGSYSSGNLSSAAAALSLGSSAHAPSQYDKTTSPGIYPRYAKVTGTVTATPNTQISVNPPLLSNTTGSIEENEDGTVNFTPDKEGTILLEDALQAMIQQQKNGNPEPLKILFKLQQNATRIKSSLPADTTLRATTRPRQTHPPEPSVYLADGINGITIPRMDTTGQFTKIKVTNTSSPSIDRDMLEGVGEFPFPMWVLVHQLRKIHHTIHQDPSYRTSAELLRGVINLSKDIDPSVPELLGYEIGYIPNFMIQQSNKTVDEIKPYYPIPQDDLTTDNRLCFVENIAELVQVFNKARNSTNGLYDPTITGYNEQFGSVKPQFSIDNGETWRSLGGSRKQKRTTRKYKNRKLTYRRNKKNRTTKNKRRYSRRK